MSVTARSILSHVLVGENPYIAAERIIEKLDAAGWEIARKPRIPEPGRYGVVAASLSGTMRSEWVSDGKNWVGLDDTIVAVWDSLVDPVLIREGL